HTLSTGACLGAALLTKFSALFLPPVLLLLGASWTLLERNDGRSWAARVRAVALALALAFATAYGMVWTGYGFRYSGVTDPEYHLAWKGMDLESSPAARAIATARSARLLPEAYVYGLAYSHGAAKSRLAFLNGRESLTGWWYYFPEA